MVLADRQGILLNEAIESAIYGDYANRTAFGDTSGGASTSFGLGSSLITVSATNIDDIIRAIKREINKAKGQALAARNGIFIVWRPQDLEILEAFMQANGFMSADRALDGSGALDSTFSTTAGGIKYMGVTHYASNLLTRQPRTFAGGDEGLPHRYCQRYLWAGGYHSRPGSVVCPDFWLRHYLPC